MLYFTITGYLTILLCRDGEDLLELIAGMQSKRMDEQRVTLPHLPGLNTNQDSDDSFIEMLVKCQVLAENIVALIEMFTFYYKSYIYLKIVKMGDNLLTLLRLDKPFHFCLI